MAGSTENHGKEKNNMTTLKKRRNMELDLPHQTHIDVL